MAMNAPGLPQYNGPRMNALPRVSAGPMATAESFGAGSARELMRLGDIGRRTGLSMLARAQEEQKRIDQAYVRDAMNQARMDMMEGAASIFAKNGIDAENAPEEMTALLSNIKGRYGSCGTGSRSCSTGGFTGGGNIERQRMLEDAMAQMTATHMQAAMRHKIRQGRVYEQQTLEMQDLALLREVDNIARGADMVTGTALDTGAGASPAVITTADGMEDEQTPPVAGSVASTGEDSAPMGAMPVAVTPEDMQRVEAESMPQPHMGDEIAKRIQLTRYNAGLRHSGSPPEYIKAKQDEAENKIHTVVLDALTEQAPEQALAYLNQDQVREVMPRADWTKRRNQVAAVIRNTAIPGMAMEAYRAGLSSTQAYEASLKFRDEKDRKAFLASYDDYAKRAESADKAAAADMKKDIIDRYIAADYDIDSMTDADRVAIKANPDLLKEIGGLRKVLDDLGKLEKDVAPNYPELDRIRKMSPDEINEWINEAGNYAQLMIWDAGKKTDELKEIFDKRMGKTSGKSGDGGGGGGNNAIAVNDMFQQSFGSINKNWWGAAIAYDPSNPEHKRQEANFRTIYNDRVGMKREAEGRKLTYSEQREMFFDLMREVRRGSVKLDRPLAEGDPMAAMDAPERSESVNPETGKKEVTFAPEKEGGDPETFEVMPYLAWQAYNVPGAKDGYIAMAPGERFGVTYEAGDRIIITVNPRTGKQDGVVLYDANYNFKTGKAGGGIAADANDFAARRGAPTPIPEPPKSPKMKAWEQEHGAVFVWEKYANRWNADKPDANEPGRNVTYQASPDGTMIYPNPFDIKITDADFLPPPPPEPESVARIRRKIERLEAEVAISERDPRTRKDLEQDKREEIKALKDEFNRISGANARASKFYVGETGKFDRPVSSEKKN